MLLYFLTWLVSSTKNHYSTSGVENQKKMSLKRLISACVFSLQEITNYALYFFKIAQISSLTVSSGLFKRFLV